ncbi:MAG: Sporulation related domain [candidate division NC10 bacterium]|jgi:cell division septation protein DedD|nr:Sporulation related domain [candidate division NC10 bacterium]
MARFNFGKRTPDDEGVPPEPVEGETEVGGPSDLVGGGNRMRRPLIFALIGVLLIGGAYLANVLFFSAPPAPTIPARPAIPVPPAAAPSPAPQAKAPVPPAPAAVPKQPEAKADAKAAPPPPSVPSKAAQTKASPPVKTSPEPTAPGKAAAPATPAPAGKLAPAQASKTTPGPIAKAEKSAPAKGAVSPTKGFSVQVGAMAQEANAQNLKQKLDGMGLPAVVRKGSGFANSHVVTVGEPTGKREAEELARRLNVDGFPSQLVTVEGKYAPQVGSFVNLDEAIDVARELQKKNFRPKITSKPATTVLYQVRHGQFDTRAAAMKRGEELKAKGFNAWVVPN